MRNYAEVYLGMSNARSIMHFTHIKNLPGILAAGCLQADSLVDGSTALKVEAADHDIKARRKRIGIPLGSCGCVADYVPFYFAPRSPMLYRLAKGGVAGYTDGQDPLIYLVSTVETAAASGASFVFSDGNCASDVTQVTTSLASLGSLIDWEVMTAKMWANTAEDPDRMRRRMAEFLVHQRFPIEWVTEIVVRHAAMKQQVNALLAAYGVELPVFVRADWYF